MIAQYYLFILGLTLARSVRACSIVLIDSLAALLKVIHMLQEKCSR